MNTTKTTKKPTIYDLAHLNREAGLHYFDRETLKFFGQTLRDFRVYRTEYPGIFLAEATSRKPFLRGAPQFRGTSRAFVSARTGKTFSANVSEVPPESFRQEHDAAPVGVWG